MIILTSRGLSNDKLMNETKKYIENNMKKGVIITTGSVEYKENDIHIPNLTKQLNNLGLTVEYLDLEYQNPQALNNYDVILINGGNPYYLLKYMRLTNCKTIFEELIKEKIIIGVSAGSVVLQNTIELINYYTPEMNDEVKLTDFRGLGIIETNILPHYSRFLTKFENFEEKAKKYEKENNVSITRLNDGEGIFMYKDKIYKL